MNYGDRKIHRITTKEKKIGDITGKENELPMVELFVNVCSVVNGTKIQAAVFRRQRYSLESSKSR